MSMQNAKISYQCKISLYECLATFGIPKYCGHTLLTSSSLAARCYFKTKKTKEEMFPYSI